jgi:hypothetical protein
MRMSCFSAQRHRNEKENGVKQKGVAAALILGTALLLLVSLISCGDTVPPLSHIPAASAGTIVLSLNPSSDTGVSDNKNPRTVLPDRGAFVASIYAYSIQIWEQSKLYGDAKYTFTVNSGIAVDAGVSPEIQLERLTDLRIVATAYTGASVPVGRGQLDVSAAEVQTAAVSAGAIPVTVKPYTVGKTGTIALPVTFPLAADFQTTDYPNATFALTPVGADNIRIAKVEAALFGIDGNLHLIGGDITAPAKQEVILASDADLLTADTLSHAITVSFSGAGIAEGSYRLRLTFREAMGESPPLSPKR